MEHNENGFDGMHVDVYFRVPMRTEFGQEVCVTGNVPELGDWNPQYGHKLTTLDTCFPCWFTQQAVVLPLKNQVLYKYVVLDETGNVVYWEPIKQNRAMVPTGTQMVIEDDDGVYRKVIPLPPKNGGNGEYADGAAAQYQSTREKELKALLDGDAAASAIDEHDTLLIASMELPVRVVRVTPGENSAPPIPASPERTSENNAKFSFPQKKSSRGTRPSADRSQFKVIKQKSLFMPLLHQLRKRVPLPTKFVGWPGIIPNSKEEEEIIEELLEPYDCIPVFPPESQFTQYLYFCHNLIWPTFHNVLTIVDERSWHQNPFDSEQWSCYQAMNQKWAELIVRHAHESDLIWIHDYHLLLVPQFVIRKFRRANIGFFLHSPFPSSEIFRSLPMREEMLRGMLCADLIGFQFFEYARHFLVACKRLLSLEHHFRLGGFLGIEYDGRSVSIQASHVNIHYDDLRKTIEESQEIALASREIRERHEDKFIFASVDRCDRLAGLWLKFNAFQSFLRNYPYARDRAMLIQYAFPTYHGWEDTSSIRKQLEDLAASVNEEFSKSSGIKEDKIIFRVKEVTPEEKYGLFLAADALVDTSLRDGLNLNPFEYICARQGKTSALILSEFTGSSRALVSASRINPWNSQQIGSTLDRAIKGEDWGDRFICDQNYLTYHSTLAWAEDFLRELRRCRKPDMLYVAWGFANTYRVVGLERNFRHLDPRVFVSSYRRSRQRVFFFDHEGTLAADRRRITAISGNDNLFSEGTPPSLLVKECLRALLTDPRNTVVILSGRGKCLLESWFGDIEGIGLCAEHGYHLKIPSLTGNEWLNPSRAQDFTWKHIATELMQQYIRRTQGSFIENKGSALVFQYRDADPDFGSWQAKELSTYLVEIMFGHPVTVVSGKGYIEVKLQGVNKGNAVKTVVYKLRKRPDEPPIDFVACIGDDRADEEMFAAALEMFPNTEQTICSNVPSGGDSFSAKSTPRLPQDQQKQLDMESSGDLGTLQAAFSGGLALGRDSFDGESGEIHDGSKLPHVFTVTVGKKPSNAQFYVNDVDEVSDLLDGLKSTITAESFTSPSSSPPHAPQSLVRARRTLESRALTDTASPQLSQRLSGPQTVSEFFRAVE